MKGRSFHKVLHMSGIVKSCIKKIERKEKKQEKIKRLEKEIALPDHSTPALIDFENLSAKKIIRGWIRR
jgi:hypothetical protein